MRKSTNLVSPQAGVELIEVGVGLSGEGVELIEKGAGPSGEGVELIEEGAGPSGEGVELIEEGAGPSGEGVELIEEGVGLFSWEQVEVGPLLSSLLVEFSLFLLPPSLPSWTPQYLMTLGLFFLSFFVSPSARAVPPALLSLVWVGVA